MKKLYRTYLILNKKEFDINKFDRIYVKLISILKKEFKYKIGNINIRYSVEDSDLGILLYRFGDFEKFELNLCKSFINESSVVLDIGANIGFHSINFAQWAYKGMVFSFEPSLKTFNILVRNVESLKNIYPLCIGLSDHTGIFEFYESCDLAYSSLKDTGRKEIACNYNIICFKLDDFFLELKLKNIGLVKIDVEGFEMEVIKGMERLIEKY